MKHMGKRIAVSTAALAIGALPVLADDATWGTGASEDTMSDTGSESGKAECMLVAQNNCIREGISENRVDRITDEINKGSATYTKEELQLLNDELDKAKSDMMDAYGGS